MFEPVPVKRSGRLRGKATATRTESQLLDHIAGLSTLGELATLRAQMDAEGVPMTKAVKSAMYDQEEMIRQEMEDDVASPNEVDERVRKLKLELLRLGRKPKRSSLFFGPGTRRMSRGRRAMMAAENADLEAALAAENARIQAEAVAAPLALAPVAAVPHNAVMNALAERFGQASLGPRNAIPYVTTKRGVPGYHFNEEGGSRRRPRKTRRSRRKTRSRR